MKVLVTDNAHLYRTPDGKYYTPTIYGYDFFKRYLNVFDEVRFVSKTKHVENIDVSKFILVSGPGLEIYELPWFQGIKGFAANIINLIKRFRNVCNGCDCYIFRVSQIESNMAYVFGRKCSKPYAVEVVNDPDTFQDMNKLLKKINTIMTKTIIKKANGASYVTKEYLQKLYPCRVIKGQKSEGFFQSYYSSIDIDEEDIMTAKKYTKTSHSFSIIHVSNSINSNIKGHKTFIESIKIVNDMGHNITGICIGEGSMVAVFKEYARKLGVEDKISFVGRINNKSRILDMLRRSDLLVLPTFMEGLPRTIIEAMVVGLPCISTPIAGIPELLDEKYLFDPNDSHGFSKKIIELIENPDELEHMSKTNIEIAKQYTNNKLTERRNEFYNRLKKVTEESI